MIESSTRSVLLAAARAVAGGTRPDLPPQLEVDTPALLHFAARHGVRRAVLEALLHPKIDLRLGGGVTRADLAARRLATVTRTLQIGSVVARSQQLLAARGIPSAAAPHPAIALLTLGRAAYELNDATLLVADQHVEIARELLSDAADPAAPVAVLSASEATGSPDVLARRRSVLTAAGPISVPDPVDQRRALERDNRGRVRLIQLIAQAVLDRQPLDEAAAERALGTPPAATAAARRTPLRRGVPELWIAGFPSGYGGADTELDHLIDLLRAHEVAVHLVPMFGCNDAARASVLARGCAIHEYRPDIFAGRFVASYCNGSFLEALPAIIAAGRPARILWFNCMTWLFDFERAAHAKQWIDLFGFQTQFQRDILMPQLEELAPVRTFPYRPFFNAARIPWRYREWDGVYRIGRISRDDGAKFAPETWQIFHGVRVPPSLRKETVVLGFGPNAEARIGPPPSDLVCFPWPPGTLPTEDFYGAIDTMIHKTGGSRENSPRVLFEAYAYGVVPIVERAFAFPELVVHGETGYMASSSDEMVEYASYLAHHPEEHRRLAENGRRHLEDIAGAERCWPAWVPVLGLE